MPIKIALVKFLICAQLHENGNPKVIDSSKERENKAAAQLNTGGTHSWMNLDIFCNWYDFDDSDKSNRDRISNEQKISKYD